jgi:hypothetical protein
MASRLALAVTAAQTRLNYARSMGQENVTLSVMTLSDVLDVVRRTTETMMIFASAENVEDFVVKMPSEKVATLVEHGLALNAD